MNDYDHSYHLANEISASPRPSPIFDIPTILWAFRKGWQYPFIGIVICITAALAYIVTKPSHYQSTAQLLIDRSISQYLRSNRIVGQLNFDIGSQVYILKSDSVLLPVVKELKLTEDPEFVGRSKDPARDPGWSIANLKQLVKDTLGLKRKPSASLGMSPERVAVETLLQHLSIYRADTPTVINIIVRSSDPKKATAIANAIAEKYLATIQRAKNTSTKLAAKFLQERLRELKNQTVSAEQALQTFKVSHKLTATNNDTQASQQLSVLRTQLIQARIAMAEAKARLDGAREAAKSGFFGILSDNAVITRLRVQQRELVSQLRNIEPRVGPSHPSVQQIRMDIGELRAAIRDEGSRMARKYTNELQASKKRARELQAAIAEIASRVESENEALTKLRELQATVKTLTALYNNTLAQYNRLPETSVTDDARIISRATPSLRKSGKKSWILLGGAAVFGFVMGGAFPIGRELIKSPFRTASQIRSSVGVFCASLPELRQFSSRLYRRRRHGPIEEWVITSPRSHFADAIRNIEACVFSSGIEGTGKVICVSSCLPDEGKTTILANLAASIATEPFGRRVLVIDGDLHKRSMTTKLAPDAKEGLLEALQVPADFAAFVVNKERTNVDVLPCASSEPVADAAKFIGSPAMGELLDAAREAYDVVLIEVPPAMSVVDIKMVERFIDGFIFVVEWGMIGRRLLNEVMREMEFLQNRLICVALNKVNPSALKALESYKRQRYGEYYIG